MSVNGSITGRRLPYEGNDSDDQDEDDARSIASSSATATRNQHHYAGRINSNRRPAAGDQATGLPNSAQQEVLAEDAPLTSLPPSSAARQSTSKGKRPIIHQDDLERVEHEDDGHRSMPAVNQVQRGRGTSFIQHSERPSQSSLKDTSVNIATAFRQAAVGGDSSLGANTIAHAPQSVSTNVYAGTSSSTRQGVFTTTTSGGSIGFLSRAGDREVPLPDTSEERDNELPEHALHNLSNLPLSDHIPSQSQAPTSASKKRKSRASSSKSRTSKDTAWKPSKEELANMSTDEYTSEGAITTDPEDLTKYVENPWGKKVYTVEYEGFGRRNGAKKRSKKRVKGDNGEDLQSSDQEEDDDEEILLDEEDIEDSIASPATKKRNAAARRGRTSARGKRQSSVTGRSRNESVDGSVTSTDDRLSQAPSQTGSQAVTSYYLHEPQSEVEQDGSSISQPTAGPSVQRQANKPEFQTAEQAGLVQTYSKAGNFQPYFAYSTTTVGASASNGNRMNGGNVPLRARRDTAVSTSTEGGSGITGQQISNRSYASRISLLDESGKAGGGPSSTASFDQRGSDYDYAEEEKMTNALLAAKERGSLAKGIPEGRNILPDLLVTKNYGQQAFNRWNQHQQNQKDREMSLNSDYSTNEPSPYRSFQSQSGRTQPQQQQQSTSIAGGSRLAPKRAPAPPPRESSAVPSETTTNTNHPPGNYASIDGSSSIHDQNDVAINGEESFAQKQAKKSLGRRLGEIVRGFFIMAYWAVAGPVGWIKGKDAQTLWKGAGAVLLVALIIGMFLCFSLLCDCQFPAELFRISSRLDVRTDTYASVS